MSKKQGKEYWSVMQRMNKRYALTKLSPPKRKRETPFDMYHMINKVLISFGISWSALDCLGRRNGSKGRTTLKRRGCHFAGYGSIFSNFGVFKTKGKWWAGRWRNRLFLCFDGLRWRLLHNSCMTGFSSGISQSKQGFEQGSRIRIRLDDWFWGIWSFLLKKWWRMLKSFHWFFRPLAPAAWPTRQACWSRDGELVMRRTLVFANLKYFLEKAMQWLACLFKNTRETKLPQEQSMYAITVRVHTARKYIPRCEFRSKTEKEPKWNNCKSQELFIWSANLRNNKYLQADKVPCAQLIVWASRFCNQIIVEILRRQLSSVYTKNSLSS